jgi:hypothetical protein
MLQGAADQVIPSWPERKYGLPSHDKATTFIETVLVYVAHIQWWCQLRKRV